MLLVCELEGRLIEAIEFVQYPGHRRRVIDGARLGGVEQGGKRCVVLAIVRIAGDENPGLVRRLNLKRERGNTVVVS